jgi:hypothetical protein
MKTLRITSLVALVLSLGGTGCMLSGERALHGCPSDEMCSDLTPRGLEFTGRHLGEEEDENVPLAVGGTARVHLHRVGGGELGPFDASVRDVSRATALAAGGDDVLLTGVASGTTTLRILEEDTDLLFDRIGVRVAEIARVRLVPGDATILHPTYTRAHDWAFFVGEEASAEVRLEDAAGTRLIDEGLSIGAGPLVVDETTYDWVTAAAPETAGTIDVEVMAGGRAHTTPFVAVTEIDGVDIVPLEGLESPRVGESTFVCAYGTSGERSVSGATTSFTVEGTALAITSPVDGIGSCVTVAANVAGTATIIAHAGAFTRALAIDVLPSDGTTSPLTGPAGAIRSLRGERASH